MKITGWTDAPIPWPEGVRVGGRSAPSIVLDEELARAVRLEAAAAIRYWWGVSAGVVWRWRKALGVGRIDNPGSRRLVLAAAAKGTAAMRWAGRHGKLLRRLFGEAEKPVREWTAEGSYVTGPQVVAAGLAEMLELG